MIFSIIADLFSPHYFKRSLENFIPPEIALNETTALTYAIKNVNSNADKNKYKNTSIATFNKKTTASKFNF